MNRAIMLLILILAVVLVACTPPSVIPAPRIEVEYTPTTTTLAPRPEPASAAKPASEASAAKPASEASELSPYERAYVRQVESIMGTNVPDAETAVAGGYEIARRVDAKVHSCTDMADYVRDLAADVAASADYSQAQTGSEIVYEAIATFGSPDTIGHFNRCPWPTY